MLQLGFKMQQHYSTRGAVLCILLLTGAILALGGSAQQLLPAVCHPLPCADTAFLGATPGMVIGGRAAFKKKQLLGLGFFFQ